MPPREAAVRVTAGLRAPQEIGPIARIKQINAAPVASVLASSAKATFPPASLSPVIPEPTTAARRKAVPRASATARRERVMDRVSPLRAATWRTARHVGLFGADEGTHKLTIHLVGQFFDIEPSV